MTQNKKQVQASGTIVILIVFINILMIKMGYMVHENWYWALTLTMPLLLLAIGNIRQRKNMILKKFPLIGYLFYFFKFMRPRIIQKYLDAEEKQPVQHTLGFKWITKLTRPGTSSEAKKKTGPLYSRTIQTEFDNSEGLTQFLQQFREFTNGKPVDLKIYIDNGDRHSTSSGTINVNARLKQE